MTKARDYMKRIFPVILILVMIFSFTGCEQVMYDKEDFIQRARKEFHIADAETIEITYIGEIVKKDKALLWFMSGNESQAHRYIPIRCAITADGGRVFEHVYKTAERGMDIAVLIDWYGGYVFCVNNPKCKTIRIDDYSGVQEIEVTEYPFLYYNSLLPRAYFFLDENGEEIS